MSLSLPDFLLARIAEDEAVARASILRNGPVWSTTDLGHNGVRIAGATEFGNPRSYRGDDSLWDDEGALGMFTETATHIARHDPARVLAECDAKRRIVEHEVEQAEYHQMNVNLRWALIQLALPYADHPDYDESWRP